MIGFDGKLQHGNNWSHIHGSWDLSTSADPEVIYGIIPYSCLQIPASNVECVKCSICLMFC